MGRPIDAIVTPTHCDDCGKSITKGFVWPTDKTAAGQVVIVLVCGECNEKRRHAR